MKLPGKAKMIRIYFGEDDKWKEKPLYRAIVEKCRELDIAGATVLRGIAGYGASSLIRESHMLSFSHDAPLMVTIIDADEKNPATASLPRRSRRPGPNRHLRSRSNQIRPPGRPSLLTRIVVILTRLRNGKPRDPSSVFLCFFTSLPSHLKPVTRHPFYGADQSSFRSLLYRVIEAPVVCCAFPVLEIFVPLPRFVDEPS